MSTQTTPQKNSENQKLLVDWLRDAYGMEQTSIQVLERQSERLKNYPMLKKRIDEHLVESRSQADRLEQCIHRLNGSRSSIKSGMGKVMGNLTALATSLMSDEVVRDSVASYTLEHFEIARYKSLIQLAERVGDTDTVRVLKGILSEEQAMADWLEKNLPEVTRSFLERRDSGQEAKH